MPCLLGDGVTVLVVVKPAQLWASATSAFPMFDRMGKAAEIIGLNDASAERHCRLTGQLPTH